MGHDLSPAPLDFFKWIHIHYQLSINHILSKASGACAIILLPCNILQNKCIDGGVSSASFYVLKLNWWG